MAGFCAKGRQAVLKKVSLETLVFVLVFQHAQKKLYLLLTYLWQAKVMGVTKVAMEKAIPNGHDFNLL